MEAGRKERIGSRLRLGHNAIRVTADVERDWQRLMQKPRTDFETLAVERAVKAADAAINSDKHVSKRRPARRRKSP